MTYETILYEVDNDTRVATITLNRPEVMNAFNRTMCHEVRDDSVHPSCQLSTTTRRLVVNVLLTTTAIHCTFEQVFISFLA